MEITVSIVMATYNGEKFLRPQIESILNQSYSNFELIVVDDTSTDQTLTILQEYADHDSRIRIFPAEKNMGLVANFERGLKLAKGEFVALSDQDDIFRNDKIELLVKKLKATPHCDLVISDLSLIDSEGNELHGSFWQNQRLNPTAGKPFRRLIYSNFATGCAMMFRCSLLDIALPFPDGILVHDWWIAVVAATKKAGGMCLLDEKLTAYRQHGGNVIGAQQVYVRSFPTFKKIKKFFTSPRQINSKNMEVRIKNHLMHSARVKSYLQSNIWSQAEKKAIEQVAALYDGYASIKTESFSKRLLVLPIRLYYALLTKRVTSCLSVLFLTFFGLDKQ